MAFPLRRVWNAVALRLGIRKSGLLRLRRDVRSCEYEDVHVMWEMLKRNEPGLDNSSWTGSGKKRFYLNFFGWARGSCFPHFCRSFP